MSNCACTEHPCICPCHEAPNHEWLSAAVWEKLLRDKPEMRADIDKAIAEFERGEGIPMSDIRAEFGK